MITNLKYHVMVTEGYMKQAQLARRLGISQARLSQYVTGTRKIPVHHLLLLSEALHAHPKDLIGYRDLESA